ncbi:MAG: phage holin family protein, partial [Aeromicrobium sp.]
MSNDGEPTIGRLVADASRDISALVQSEIDLAKSELSVSVKAGGIGALLLGIAGFFGAVIIILGSFAGAYFIVMAGLDPAWAVLIVTGVYVVLAGLLILVGILKLKKI